MDKEMEAFCYSRPPITEAVIEVRFSKSLDDKETKKVVKKLRGNYQHLAEINSADIAVDIGNKTVKDTNNVTKYRFTSEDQTEAFILSTDRLTVAQLAPYCGWGKFLDRFVRDFQVWLSCTSYREIVQIGVRYINRIDLPVEDGKVEHEEYLNVYPSLPPLFELVDDFATHIVVSFHDIGCGLKLNCGVVKSPLEKHMSFLFDQDIIKNRELPPLDVEAVVELLEVMRVRKNEVFESSITDKARGLFHAEG